MAQMLLLSDQEEPIGETIEVLPNINKRRKNKEYVLYQKYKTKDEAKAAIASLKIWSTTN